MRSPLLASLLLAGCLTAGAAHAYGRDPKQFAPPPEKSAEQIALEKERSKAGSNMVAYGKDAAAKPEPFPWMTAGFFGLVIAIVTPFAIRAYKNTAQELTPERKARARDEAEEEA
jgi:hypothetical protein